ncbi:MAG: SDR family NAD(P)-dependent oxidoreductase [Micromonosporaceae bacterium]
MGDLTGRVVVVTGASSGIGLAAAEQLARQGHQLAIAGRDPGRLAAAVERVREAGGRTPDAYRADFAVLDEVRELGKKLRDAYPRIDVLANNAGLMSHHRSMTVDGFELTMQVNHLAGFLLAHLLLDSMPTGARLITTASSAARFGELDPGDLSGSRHRYHRWQAYGSSKQANLLFTAEAARRWSTRGIVATCFHPGSVSTRFGRGNPLIEAGLRLPVFQSPQSGADTLVWLVEEAGTESGGYYRRRRARTPYRSARDPRVAHRLWDASAEAVGLP